MIVLDLEVIDLDRAFEQLVLDFFDDDILTVDKDENVARAEVRCIRPALDRTIERVRRRGNNFLAAHENVRQLGRLVDIGFDDRLERNVPGFFIPRPNKVPRSDFFNCNIPCRCSNSRSGNKACAIFQITGIAAHAALYCAGDCAGKSAVAHALQCSLPGAFPASGF